MTQLLELIVEPDTAAWKRFGDHLPYLFVNSGNRVRSDASLIASAAQSALDGAVPFPPGGDQWCWSFTDGGVTLTASAVESAGPRAVLAVDDRGDRISNLEGKAWKEWLRLSNWLGLSDRHRVSTYSLLSSISADTGIVAAEDESLPAAWKALYKEAVSDAEKQLIRALAEAGAVVPTLGYETDDGDVIDLAWADARVGVTFDGDSAADGWTLCPADVSQILAALKSNGVM